MSMDMDRKRKKYDGQQETSKTPRIMTAPEEDGIGMAKKKKTKGRQKKRKTIAQGHDLKKEENIRKKEENIRKKEENIRKKEENIGKKEEDIRKIVEHITKLKADEACDKAFFMKLLQKDSARLDKMMEELVECQADLKKDQEDLKKDQAALEKAQVHNCTFYLIDVNRPARVEQQKTTCTSSYSIDDLIDDCLIPASIFNDKLFENGSDSGSYNLVGKHDGIWNYVFTWEYESSINACQDSYSYYSKFVNFSSVKICLPVSTIPEKFECFDRMGCKMVPVHSVERICQKFHRKIEEIKQCSSLDAVMNALSIELEATEPMKEQEFREDKKQMVIYGIHIFTVESFETQISDLFYNHIVMSFDDFDVVRESRSASNQYSPFLRSRTDFCILRKSTATSAAISAASFSFAHTSLFEGLSIEAKMNAEDNDKFQMLANMEMTAAKIADQKLLLNGRIDHIKVIGALLDYKSKSGTIYMLTLHFTCNSSSVTYSQKIPSISRVIEYVFNNI